jgi:hypothetical protein
MSQVVLSIDIGLYNLALCCLNHCQKDDKPHINILSWDLIDVIDKDENVTPKKKCSFQMSRKKQLVNCTRNASVTNDTGQHFCTQHGKSLVTSHAISDVRVCATTVGGRPCKNKATCVENETFFCTKHAKGKETCHIQGSSLLKDIPLQSILWKLHLALSKWSSDNKNILDTVTRIVIEKQPMENKKMQVASHVIFYHFMTLFNNNLPIILLPAYHKLDVYDGPHVECALKTKYAQRKFLSVCYTNWYLDNLIVNADQFKEKFNATQKKDDLGDSFLQGLFVLLGKAKSTSIEPKGKRRKRKKKLHF